MELTSALIWTLRIVLPIILSCIFFKWQSSKEDQTFVESSANKNKISRGKLLAHRQAVDTGTVPDELATLTRKTQAEAPQLFRGPEKGRGKGGGKRNREPKEDRGSGKEPKEPREQRRARDAPDKVRSSKKEDKTAISGNVNSEEMAHGPSAQGAAQMKESEEKMNLESFLNYVAFNKKAPVQTLDLSDASADKANAEAQMVLRGALNFKRVDVAKELYDQLAAANVDIFSATFSLMIEASVLAKDLKTSSDFLMKMESSGHSPSSELLDKVLDLYSNQKTQRDVKKSSKEEDGTGNGAIEKEVILPRQKLKSDARIFVPSFGIPPPPPTPKPVDEGLPGRVEADSLRTKLMPTAKPFEPSVWMADSAPLAPGEWDDPKTAAPEASEAKQNSSRNGKKEEGKKMWKPKAPACAPEEAGKTS